MHHLENAPNLQPDFYKSQYEGLRREIELGLTESRSIERYAAIAAGAVWAWLATNGTSAGYGWCWFIPIAFPILGGLRAYAILGHFGLIGSYLRLLEKKVCDQNVPGWETFLQDPQKYNPDAPSKRRHSISRTGSFFWAGLLVATIAIGCAGNKLPAKVSQNVGVNANCK